MNEMKNPTPTTTDKQPPGVMLYAGFYEALKNLPDEMIGQLIRALMEYVQFGVVPQFEGAAACAWGFIKTYTDEDIARYQRIVHQRRAAINKRWDKEHNRTNRNGYGKTQRTSQAEERSPADGEEWMKKYMKRNEEQ